MVGCSNYPTDNQLLEKIFNSMGNNFPEIVSDPEKYRIQIQYSQIDRDVNQKPEFTTYTFRTDSNKYFYPASTVKFPSAVLALDKLKIYSFQNIDKNTHLTIGGGYDGMTEVIEDISSINKRASIAHYGKIPILIFLLKVNNITHRQIILPLVITV